MKGLLLKDWYAIKSYFVSFFVLYVVLLAMACFESTNFFLLLYPCILSGSIAMSLIAYEEKEKWNLYAATLPYSRAQLVSAKYLVTLLAGTGTSMMILATQTIVRLSQHTFMLSGILDFALMMVPFYLLPSTFLLPFVYRLGAEKGRILYFVVLGGFSSFTVLIDGVQRLNMWAVGSPYLNLLVAVISVLLFAGSWWLSIHFYEKRDLNG